MFLLAVQHKVEDYAKWKAVFDELSEVVSSFSPPRFVRWTWPASTVASAERGPLSGADVMRGALALRLGKVDAAERHYTEGLEWARKPDVRFGLVEGRCLQGLADVAEARGDHALAMQHLDGGAAKFAEYGAKLYLDQVLAKKQVLGA